VGYSFDSAKINPIPRAPMQKKRTEVKNIAMAGIHHLDTTDTNMARLIEANAHLWPIRIQIFKDLQWMHVFFRVMFFKATF
jgi:hypothetical protein